MKNKNKYVFYQCECEYCLNDETWTGLHRYNIITKKWHTRKKNGKWEIINAINDTSEFRKLTDIEAFTVML